MLKNILNFINISIDFDGGVDIIAVYKNITSATTIFEIAYSSVSIS